MQNAEIHCGLISEQALRKKASFVQIGKGKDFFCVDLTWNDPEAILAHYRLDKLLLPAVASFGSTSSKLTSTDATMTV